MYKRNNRYPDDSAIRELFFFFFTTVVVYIRTRRGVIAIPTTVNLIYIPILSVSLWLLSFRLNWLYVYNTIPNFFFYRIFKNKWKITEQMFLFRSLVSLFLEIQHLFFVVASGPFYQPFCWEWGLIRMIAQYHKHLAPRVLKHLFEIVFCPH